MIIRNRIVETWWAKAEGADILLFDLDGTLINSDLANFLSYEAAVSSVLSIKSEMIFNPNKRTTRETIKSEFPSISHKKLSQIISEKERLYCKFLSKTILNTNASCILKKSNGKEIILATNSRKSRAEMLLAHHGISKMFTRKFFKEDLNTRNKYQKIFSKISIDNIPIVIFEDDPLDISQAIAAGINSEFVINVREKW